MAENQDRRRPSVAAVLRQDAPALSPIARRAGWVRLRSALDRRQAVAKGRHRRVLLAAAGASGLLVAALIAGGLVRRPGGGAGQSPPLTFTLDRGQMGVKGAIANADPTGARLRFSDGSNVVLRPAARVQVVAVEGRGARIALSDGEVAVDVVHRPRARWRFDAGPFSVFVEGTAFSLAWTPADERLNLRMFSGLVTVTGPLGTEAMRVRGGQTLSVRWPERQVSLLPSSSAQVSAEASAEITGLGSAGDAAGPRAPGLSPAAAGESERVSTAHAPAARRSASEIGAGWRELIAAGRSASVVAAARRRGLGLTLARGGRDDLAALADAARYSQHHDVARRALHALRDRFAASESARDAAFFLGRLEEASDARSPRSLEWYRRYRTEAPAGLYVSEALGREMLIMRRLYGDEGARAVAGEYLARFPHGHFAAQAIEITRATSKSGP